ncbi:MAG: ATP-binding protein [Thiolinea sp.]
MRSLVRQHEGDIAVLSHAPGNTVFVIRFPDADREMETPA